MLLDVEKEKKKNIHTIIYDFHDLFLVLGAT